MCMGGSGGREGYDDDVHDVEVPQTSLHYSVPGYCQPSWQKWGLPPFHHGLVREQGERERERQRIGGETIPYLSDKPVKFLGKEIHIPPNQRRACDIVSSRLKDMLHRTDSCPITTRQKLRVYRAAICPCLSWLLTVQEFPITWVRNELKALAIRFLKKWSSLTHTVNTAILYMRQLSGGLNLPSITTFYKKLQVS